MEEGINQLEEIAIYENPVNMIARELRKEGYAIAGNMGVRVDEKRTPTVI